MNRHDLVQGSAAWHAHRAQCWNASDAPAMMGCSPYKTRAQFLKEVATGVTQDVDAGTQRLFDDGHRFEALARPLGEKVIGEDLSPLSGSIDAGLSRPLAASFDGITFMADFVWEHKSLNDELRAILPDHCIGDTSFGAVLPLQYRVQMEQQAAVSGALRVLFTASKWQGDELIEARHCWYTPDPELRARILAGWKQFEADVAAYVPAEAAAPKPTGTAPETLPALRIEVTGMVTASNLDAFKTHALQVIGGINRDLQTDADFANAEAAVKWCGTVEERLEAAKQHALSQTETIDALFRTIDDISAEARRVRLDLDKLVKARKEQIRQEIAGNARTALLEHYRQINDHMAGIVTMNPPQTFSLEVLEAMKGKRTVDTLRDAASTVLAKAKAEANTAADRYLANSKAMGDNRHLFPDFAAVGAKAAEDFEALLALRVRNAKDAADKLEAERLAKAQAAAPAPVAAAVSAPAPEVVPLRPAAPAANEAPTLSLGEIKNRIAPLSIDAAGLETLGFPANKERGACLYRDSQWEDIKAAMLKSLAGASPARKAA